MRIIAKNHDYYDCIQAQGQDSTCVWNRRIEELILRSYKPIDAHAKYAYAGRDWTFPKLDRGPLYLRGHAPLDCTQFIVGFCGKIYPVLCLQMTGKKQAFCHDFESADNFIKENLNKKLDLESYNDKSQRRRRFFKTKNRIGIRKVNLKSYFNACEEHKGNFSKIFLENKCPVFIAEYRPHRAPSHTSAILFHGRQAKVDDEARVIGRPFGRLMMLKDLEFYKVFDAYTAFQEIHMYLGGVLGFDNPHVPVPDDKTMRDIKGFDNLSFKKSKTKNK